MKQLSQSRVEIMSRQLSTISIILLATTLSFKTTLASHLNNHMNNQQQNNLNNQNNRFYSQQSAPLLENNNQIPLITPFHFDLNVQENQRSSVLCTISSGELPVSISWLKDGQLLTPQLAQAKKITIKPDSDQSTLKFTSVRLDHSGNYTCVAKNRAGIQAHSAQLIVHAEPHWIIEPLNEPVVTTKGQTVVIDCQSIGWPKPQQSWHIKTHLQNEFEQLLPTTNGKISISTNGSLIIRNVDKLDEANYLCKATNGIGNGKSWSTSLKVTVPAHFEAPNNRQQTNVIRKQNQVQLRCDAYGDEPLTIEWFKNKQRLNNEFDPRFSIHNKPLNNGLISILVIKSAQRQDNSIFECVTRNPVGKDRLPIELLVQEEPDNIDELNVEQISSRSITLNWTEPYDGRSGITNYMFQYKKIQDSTTTTTTTLSSSSASHSIENEFEFPSSSAEQSSSSQSAYLSSSDIASSSSSKTNADDWQHATRIMLPVQGSNSFSGNTRLITIENLEPSTKYVLRALAMNAIGQSKFSQPMEFQTEDVAPELKPTNVRTIAINSTSIHVSWDEIPRIKQSKIHGYYIGYRVAPLVGSQLNLSATYAQAASSIQNNNFVYKPYLINNDLIHQQQQQESTQLSQQQQQRLDFTIHDLRRDTLYEIIVLAFNGRGSGPKSDSILCKTIEMEPPKAVKLQIRNESNDSIFIEWQRDPLDQSPVDDYVLYQEKSSVSQEWLHIRFPGNQTHYKAPGLKCGTRYQFYIIAYNKIGKSQPSEVVGASTSGSLPIIPAKTSLLKLVNSTCLLINLNSFQDDNCRIRTFTVRYKVEKTNTQNGPGSGLMNTINGLSSQHQALTSSSHPLSSSTSLALDSTINAPSSSSQHTHLNQASSLLLSSSSSGVLGSAASLGIPASSISAPSSMSNVGSTAPVASATTQLQPSGEWITIRPKSNIKHQFANEEDRMEYLCDLNPIGEYTIHVAALNDVGRSEIEYTASMASDELRPSILKEFAELFTKLPNIFKFIPSMIVFFMASLFFMLAFYILYTTIVKYYQKFVIIHNQIRASRRAKQDEKRRRNLMNSNHLSSSSKLSQRLDLWADEFDEDENDENDEDEDGAGVGVGVGRQAQMVNSNGELANVDCDNANDDCDDGDADDDNSSSSGSGTTLTTTTTTSRGSEALMGRQHQRRRQQQQQQHHAQNRQLHNLNNNNNNNLNNNHLYHSKQQQFQQHHLHQRQLSQQTISAAHLQQQKLPSFATIQRQRPTGSATVNGGHYISNISDSAFYAPSIESPCSNSNSGKQCFNGSATMSTASNDSIHGRFQCLNTRQYTKMNEYTLLPSISGSLSQARPGAAQTKPNLTNDIYGTTTSAAALPTGRPSPQQQGLITAANGTSPVNNSLYYSTLRRSSMQTYLPQQATTRARQVQQQQLGQNNANNGSNRQSQNIADIYGYYMAPSQMNSNDNSPKANHHHDLQQQQQQQQQQLGVAVNDEAANSILVLPQQIIYSAPNIRRQPVFL